MKKLLAMLLLVMFCVVGYSKSSSFLAFSTQRALSETDLFMPLPPGEDGSAYFYFTNRTRRATTLYAKISDKSFPKGPNDPDWFVQFCFSTICFLDEGESPNRVQPNQSDKMHIMVLPMDTAKVGDKAKVSLDVWPSSDKSMKETITIYVVVVEEKVVKMQIDSKQASIATSKETKSVTLDVPPFITSGRTMVPLRFIGEALDAEILWDNTERRVTYILGEMRLFFWIDQRRARLNIGPRYTNEVALDVAPVIVQSRTFVPVRYVSEFLGAEVGWDASSRTVTVNFPKIVKSDLN